MVMNLHRRLKTCMQLAEDEGEHLENAVQKVDKLTNLVESESYSSSSSISSSRSESVDDVQATKAEKVRVGDKLLQGFSLKSHF